MKFAQVRNWIRLTCFTLAYFCSQQSMASVRDFFLKSSLQSQQGVILEILMDEAPTCSVVEAQVSPTIPIAAGKDINVFLEWHPADLPCREDWPHLVQRVPLGPLVPGTYVIHVHREDEDMLTKRFDIPSDVQFDFSDNLYPWSQQMGGASESTGQS